jgi:hypothetical protein
VRGMRKGKSGYGGTVFTDKEIKQLGSSRGYQPLVVDIAHMFRTGEVRVPVEQTIAVYALMDAADESKRLGGVPVNVPELIAKAREQAVLRLNQAKAELDKASAPAN